MDTSGLILLVSLLAGVVGTGVGGMMGALFADKGDAATGRVLAFAGGVMLGVVAFDMIPEALAGCGDAGKYGALIALAFVILGMAAIFIFNKLQNAFTHTRKADVFCCDAVVRAASADGRGLIRAGVAMFFAIAFHNLPEGMAIGAAGALEKKAGIVVAIVIAIHNIPEGMAIGAPLAGGGVKPVKAVALASLAGAATVLGAIIGLVVGGIGKIATGICMSVAGGAMLCVVFFDILPQSVNMLKGKTPSGSLLAGIICAAVFAYSF